MNKGLYNNNNNNNNNTFYLRDCKIACIGRDIFAPSPQLSYIWTTGKYIETVSCNYIGLFVQFYLSINIIRPSFFFESLLVFKYTNVSTSTYIVSI